MQLKIQKNLKITEGVIWKQVLLFFIPIVIGAFFQHLYTIVDTIVVGKGLGTIELSAVGGSASKLIVMVTNFFLGVSIGITSYASRYYGKKDFKMLKSITFNGLFAFTVIGVVISGLGLLFSNEFLLLLKTPEETLYHSNIYLKTYLSGIIFCVIYNALAGVLRAMGDAVRPLYVLIFCSLLNISLDILLALVLGMGVFGVALATVISQLISAIVLIKILTNALKGTQQYKIKIEGGVIKDILAIGIPAGMQSMMYSFSNMVVQSGVNTFGAVSVAAWTTYVRLNGIIDVFVSSLGNAAVTFVGQNYGANRLDRVKESVNQIIIISYAIVITIFILFVVNRYTLLSLFTHDAQVIALGANLMFVILPMYLVGIPQQMYSQALRGLGISFVPMLLTLLGVVGLRIFWVYFILPFNKNLMLLGGCYPASSLLMSVIFTIYYKYEIGKITNRSSDRVAIEAC